MWEGQPGVVLASGESMGQSVADAVRYYPGVRTLVVNNTHELAPWADILYAADADWWNVHHEKTAGFLGLKVSVDDTRFDDVLKLKDGGKEGFDPDPATIRTGGNGGYAGVHILAHAGCNPILLCGFDMRPGHWHAKHCSPLREPGEGTMARWIERFAGLAPELAKRGVTVLNCTPDSALRCFPFADLGESLRPGNDRVADDVLHLHVESLANAA